MEFLSPHGLRSLSAAYRGRPFEFWQAGHITATVDYEPAESTTPLFGGNSNWRASGWIPKKIPSCETRLAAWLLGNCSYPERQSK